MALAALEPGRLANSWRLAAASLTPCCVGLQELQLVVFVSRPQSPSSRTQLSKKLSSRTQVPSPPQQRCSLFKGKFASPPAFILIYIYTIVVCVYILSIGRFVAGEAGGARRRPSVSGWLIPRVPYKFRAPLGPEDRPVPGGLSAVAYRLNRFAYCVCLE